MIVVLGSGYLKHSEELLKSEEITLIRLQMYKAKKGSRLWKATEQYLKYQDVH